MKEKTSISQKLQKFGSVLAGMVIPNIGAFIGFGLITAFFLENRMDSKCKTCKTDQSNLKLLTSNLNWTYWW